MPALKKAIAAAPRSQREQWLLRIEINGAAVSPLYWAIRDGQVLVRPGFVFHDKVFYMVFSRASLRVNCLGSLSECQIF